jgi:hypothetical protein
LVPEIISELGIKELWAKIPRMLNTALLGAFFLPFDMEVKATEWLVYQDNMT